MYLFKKWAQYLIIFVPILVYSQDVPWWIESAPTSDNTKYVGIGWASTDQPDYSLKAEQNAFRSIALEINTQISGQTRRRVISINDISPRSHQLGFGGVCRIRVEYKYYMIIIIIIRTNNKGIK